MEEDRKLTKKEQIRKEKVEKIINQKESEGYKSNDLTMSIVYANVMAFVICIPICVLFIVPFAYLYSTHEVPDISPNKYLLFMIVFFISIVVHELIHGFFWGLSAPSKFKAIEFGVVWKMLTPYCTCLEPLKKGQYILGTSMPTIILGIIPLVISLFNLNILLMIFGCISVLGGGGDMLVILKLLLHKSKGKDTIYLDHPYKIGLLVLEKE